MSEHGLRVSNFVAGALMSIPKCIPEFLSVSLHIIAIDHIHCQSLIAAGTTMSIKALCQLLTK